MKTVKVRIAVAVDPTGEWSASGCAGETDSDSAADARALVDAGEAIYWLTAELPVPEAQEIEAIVEEAKR